MDISEYQTWWIRVDNDTEIICVNSISLIRLMKYIVGAESEENVPMLDPNGDGKTNILDVVRLMRYLAGNDVELK